PTERWYPTTRWAVGETIVVEQRGVQAPRGTRIGMRVERGDVAAPISEPPQAGASELIEAGVVKLGIGN
ncbi:MAG: hypothetical protein ABI874_04600, partial [Chloroflexota bacterium]